MLEQNILPGIVFIAGLLSFFAPCTFPLIPVYIGLLGDSEKEYERIAVGKFKLNIGAVIKTVCFVFGLSTSFIILGFGAGFLGSFLSDSRVIFIAGLLVIILGLHQMELIHIKKLDTVGGISVKNNKTKALGSYLLGISFSLGWTPCVGPVLGAVLTLSAGKGQALYGAFLMLIYTLGLAIPFIVMVLASDFMMSRFSFIKKHLLLIKRIGGLMVVIMGIVLMSGKLSNLSAFFEKLVH